MRNLMMFAIAGVLVLAGGSAGAQKAARSPSRPTPVILPAIPAQPLVPMATLSAMTATPATIQFTANDPGSAVAGNSSATVQWTITNGTPGNTWTLSVYANSTTFTGCTTVPASAVGVTCSSATHTGGSPTATCVTGGPFTLPTTAPGQELASGNEGGTRAHTFTVVLNYQFTDSWEFIANTCPLTITYTVNAP
jgi:hypothetical protein